MPAWVQFRLTCRSLSASNSPHHSLHASHLVCTDTLERLKLSSNPVWIPRRRPFKAEHCFHIMTTSLDKVKSLLSSLSAVGHAEDLHIGCSPSKMEHSRTVNSTVEEPASSRVNPSEIPGNVLFENPFATPIAATPVAASLRSRRTTYARTGSANEGALNPHEEALAYIDLKLTKTRRRAAPAVQEQPAHWRV